MKKIFAVIALLFAFTTVAFAQESEVETLAKKDAAELTSVLKLNNAVSKRVYIIFIHKHKSLAANPTEEDKKDLFKRIRKEIKDMLTHDQLVLLENNSKAFNDLTLR